MNQLAMLGGTTSYQPAENGAELSAALRAIARDVVSQCKFEVAELAASKFVRIRLDNRGLTLNGSMVGR